MWEDEPKIEESTLTFTRSDLDQITAVDGKPPHRRWTTLEWVKEHGVGRTDIGMVNRTTTIVQHEQLMVYPTASGEPTGDGWELLSDNDKQICRAENRRLIEVAKIHPEFSGYLNK